jgi:uncharacterized protein (UPF0276 family)
LELYGHTVGKLGPTWTLLEWDNNIPPLETLLEENQRVRKAADLASRRAA